MKSVRELLRDKNYELLARLYFDWVAVRLGNGDFEAGLRELARRYNAAVFGNVPFSIPSLFDVPQWAFFNGMSRVTKKEEAEINRCFENELKNRVEEELHHQNPLNP